MIIINTLKFISKTNIRKFSSVKLDNKRVGIIGVPFYKGQPNPGVDLGPKFLRDDGKLLNVLKTQTNLTDVKDYGDVIYQPITNPNSGTSNLKNLPDVAGVNKSLSDKVFEVLKDERVCVTLGGDHSIGIGTLDGHLRHNPDTAVFWIDAHADINTNVTSHSGNIHGMPLSFILNELKDTWKTITEMTTWLQPRLPAKNLVYIGLRDVDDGEKKFIKQLGIHAYGMKEIDRYGIKDIMNMAFDRVDSDGDKLFHCSFDIDSLDPREAPSTGTRVRGGLSLREGVQIVEMLHDTGRLEAFDLTEVNPKIGSPEDVKTTIRAAIAILSCLGGNRYAY